MRHTYTMSSTYTRDAINTLCEDIEHVYDTIDTFDYLANVYQYDYYAPKIYVRVHKPTRKWFVGFTTRGFAIIRHNEDIVKAVLLNQPGKKYDLYRQTIPKHVAQKLRNHRESDPEYEASDEWKVCAIARFDDEETAKRIEANVINTLVSRNIMPRELCLNMTHTKIPEKKETKINPILAKCIQTNRP